VGAYPRCRAGSSLYIIPKLELNRESPLHGAGPWGGGIKSLGPLVGDRRAKDLFSGAKLADLFFLGGLDHKRHRNLGAALRIRIYPGHFTTKPAQKMSRNSGWGGRLGFRWAIEMNTTTQTSGERGDGAADRLRLEFLATRSVGPFGPQREDARRCADYVLRRYSGGLSGDSSIGAVLRKRWTGVRPGLQMANRGMQFV
jgi:hypothetical protein